MIRSRAGGAGKSPALEIGFLLSQIGAHAAARFAERLEPLGLKPAHAGILKVLDQSDGLSQQGLGETLGAFPSRLVGLIDELERLGLVERRDNPADRRSYSLHINPAGREMLIRIGRAGCENQDTLCDALTESEKAQLGSLLARIAAQQGLAPGVHPGFRKLGAGDKDSLPGQV
jgi:DNA-binding MarR family transcriptional regulator